MEGYIGGTHKPTNGSLGHCIPSGSYYVTFGRSNWIYLTGTKFGARNYRALSEELKITVARLFLGQEQVSLFQELNLLNNHFCQELNMFMKDFFFGAA